MSNQTVDPNKLVEDNLNLVWSIVNKFYYVREEKEDLFQSGCIGLIMASKKFDPSLGNAFSTFAVSYILGEIKNYLRSKNQIKVSKRLLTIKRNIKKLGDACDNLSVNEIAKKLNISYEDVVMTVNTTKSVVSLDNTVFHDSDVSFSDMNLVDNYYSMENNLIEFKEIFNEFSKLEKLVFYYRFYYGYNQTETAKKLMISQSKVSRTESKMIESLKNSYFNQKTSNL